MWARVFPADTPVRDIDVDRLARLTVTGAAIHGIALTAAFMAAARDQAVDMALIREAARLEMRKREQPRTRWKRCDSAAPRRDRASIASCSTASCSTPQTSRRCARRSPTS